KGNYDLYVVFVERSLQLLQERGLISRAVEDERAVDKIRYTLLRHVVHFGDLQIFPGATNYVCLLFLAAGGAPECRWVSADDLQLWLSSQQAPESNFAAARISENAWNFAVGKDAALFEK